MIQNVANPMLFVKSFPMDKHFVYLFKHHLNHLLIDGSRNTKNKNLLFRNKFNIFFFSWNEWLTLPLRYCDLPRHAILTFSIHQIVSPTDIRITGSTTISLFASDG